MRRMWTRQRHAHTSLPAALVLPAVSRKDSAQGAWVRCPGRRDPSGWGSGEGFHLNKALGCSGKLTTQPRSWLPLFTEHTLLVEAMSQHHGLPDTALLWPSPPPGTGTRERGQRAGNTSRRF